MVGNQVPSFCYSSSYMGTHGDEASDQEESSRHLMPRQHFEQTLGVDVVRTIIKCERQLIYFGAARQRPSIKLGSR